MKRTIVLLLTLACSQLSFSQSGLLTKTDKQKVIDYLKETTSASIQKVKGLNQEEWNFKPDETSWSPSEICEHILIGEEVVVSRVSKFTENEYKPEMMVHIDAKAREMIDFIVKRETKLTAPPRVTPEGIYDSPKTFIKAMKDRRKETIEFVKNLDRPVKAHYEVFGPIGEVNGYHWLLFISAHTERHLAQLEELLGTPKG